MTLSEILNGVKEIATTGTQAYDSVVQTQTDKMTEKAAITPAVAAPVAKTAPIGTTPTPTPWYKAAWVIPSAIGLVLVLVLVFVIRRKR